MSKTLDLITIGRSSVDLYGAQIGGRLEDMGSFDKYIGGSPTNIACGTARLGLKSAVITGVGDEHMGRFIREQLVREGVNTEGVKTDPDRLTALVLLGIRDQDQFPLIFYRENCADMGLTVDDIDPEFVRSARAVVATGTHLSHPQVESATIKALEIAREAQMQTALDIDYRPNLWGVAGHGDGESRFVESDKVTAKLQSTLHLFDLIVGTEEEFHIAGGSTNTVVALKSVRSVCQAELVCKRGALGSSVFSGDVPSSLDEGITVEGVKVDVLNVLGAGDAFMSGLLRGYLNDEGWEKACAYANACGALVVSRHGCAPAMPTKEELDNYLARAQDVLRPDQDSQLNHLHRVTTRQTQWDELCVLAFDHRSQFEQMAKDASAGFDRISILKQLIYKASLDVSQEESLAGKFGLLCDGTFGQQVLNVATGTGTWIGRPIEEPGSRPLQLEHGDIGSQLRTWPLEHVVKCLVFCHPDDDIALRLSQEKTVKEVYDACCQSGHELLLEVILPKGMTLGDKQYLTLMNQFYSIGVKPDWWKLPPLSELSWKQVELLIQDNDPHCRGILILGLDAPLDEVQAGFNAAANCLLVKGFAVGRTIFGLPSSLWLANDINDEELISQIKSNYSILVRAWQQRNLSTSCQSSSQSRLKSEAAPSFISN